MAAPLSWCWRGTAGLVKDILGVPFPARVSLKLGFSERSHNPINKLLLLTRLLFTSRWRSLMPWLTGASCYTSSAIAKGVYGPQGSASRHGLVTKLCYWDTITKDDIILNN